MKIKETAVGILDELVPMPEKPGRKLSNDLVDMVAHVLLAVSDTRGHDSGDEDPKQR